MEKPTAKTNYDKLAALVEISIERLKQAEAAPGELSAILSKLEALANAALSEAKTLEEEAAVHKMFHDQCARVNKLYWELWPYRTSAFQLACVAAPFAAANASDHDSVEHAKRLMTMAETRLEHWKNPPPKPRTEFTAGQALEMINERARASRLKTWKSVRPLRKLMREYRGDLTEEAFKDLWLKAQNSPEITSYALMDIWELKEKKRRARQEKAAAGRRRRPQNLETK